MPLNMTNAEKIWDGRKNWGLSYDWDPIWLQTTAQAELLQKLMDTCRKVILPNAVRKQKLHTLSIVDARQNVTIYEF